MQLIWDFGIGLREYAARVQQVVFPLLLDCPVCGAGVRLHRHGFYFRNVLARAAEYRVAIARYICRSCQHTVSLLPLFLVPRFQTARNVILESLIASFSKGKTQPYRQMAYYYRRRFARNLNAIIAALRDVGYRERLPDGDNERAIKVVDRLKIVTPPDSPVRNGHFSIRVLSNFMALSL